MNRATRLLVYVLSTAALLAFATGVASGNRGIGTNLREGESFSATGRTTFEDGEFFGLRRIICDVTLTFNVTRSLVVKATGGVMFEVVGGTAAPGRDSVGNSARCIFLAERVTSGPRHPFPLSYTTFLGTLPEISGILFTIERFAFEIEDPSGGCTHCLYEGRQGILFTVVRREVTSMRFLSSDTIPLVSCSGTCPTSLRVIGTLVPNRTITITLLN